MNGSPHAKFLLRDRTTRYATNSNGRPAQTQFVPAVTCDLLSTRAEERLNFDRVQDVPGDLRAQRSEQRRQAIIFRPGDVVPVSTSLPNRLLLGQTSIRVPVQYIIASAWAGWPRDTRAAIDPRNPIRNAFILQICSLRMAASIGISSPVELLQIGQGAPTPPQLKACGPCHGLPGWFSQTQP